MPNLQTDIDGHALLNIDLYRLRNTLLEPWLLDGNGITADAERAGNILALVIGGRVERGSPVDLGHNHFDVGHDCASGIPHDSHNASAVLLREAGTVQNENDNAKIEQRKKEKPETPCRHDDTPCAIPVPASPAL